MLSSIALTTFKDLIFLFLINIGETLKKTYIYLPLLRLKEFTPLKVSLGNESIYDEWKKIESNLMFNSNNHWQKKSREYNKT